MHITILSFFSGLIQRGVEVHVQELSQRLTSPFRVKIISAQDLPCKISPYTGRENPLPRRFYLDKTSLQIKKLTRTVLVKLAQNPPDILYPVNNGWQSILAKHFCRKYSTKLLLAGHSGPGWDDRMNLWLCPDAFIVFSQSQKNWVQRVNRRVKIKIIPHAIDLTQFSPKKPQISLKLKPPIFVTVSALSPQSRGGLPAIGLAKAGETHKNIEATIRAIAALKRGSLLLVGSGSDANRLDFIANQLLGPNRYQRVTVSHNIINQYYQTADVFTLASSSSEAFGLVYLEALASNLPIVTFDDSLRRQIIGQAGIFIKNPQDIEEYSRGLVKALKTNWGNKPRIQAQQFSWDKIIPLYHQLFNSLK